MKRKHTVHIWRREFVGVAKVIAFLSLVNIFPALGQENPLKSAPEQARLGTSSLKVNVGLVVVHATVLDPDYRFVKGLEKENFEVYEDKVPQTISQFGTEDVSASIGLLFDVSRSMGDSLGEVRDAAVAFFKTNNQADEYFLLTFSDRPVVDQEFTSDMNTIQNQLAFVGAKGHTTLYDATYLALEKMKQAHNPKRAILLVTDGEDTYSRYSLRNLYKAIKESDVPIYAIGIACRDDTDETVLEKMAELSGGEAFFPYSGEELEDMCKKIARELRSQYLLGYSSTNTKKDGRWRKIKVRLQAPKGVPRLSVHAKAGYYAPTG